MHLLPASALAIHAIYSRQFDLSQRNRSIDIAIWTALLNLIPYWLSPYGSTRYILPTFPFFALIMAYFIVRSGKLLSNGMARLLVANIAIGWSARLSQFLSISVMSGAIMLSWPT
jgi:hypothetical protein